MKLGLILKKLTKSLVKSLKISYFYCCVNFGYFHMVDEQHNPIKTTMSKATQQSKRRIKKRNFKKIATVYKMILKNSHSFKKFKN